MDAISQSFLLPVMLGFVLLFCFPLSRLWVLRLPAHQFILICLILGVGILAAGLYVTDFYLEWIPNACVEYQLCESGPLWIQGFLYNVFATTQDVLSRLGITGSDLNTDTLPTYTTFSIIVVLYLSYVPLALLDLLSTRLEARYPRIANIVRSPTFLLFPPKRRGPMEDIFFLSIEKNEPVILVLNTNSVHIGYVSALPSLAQSIEGSSLGFVRVYSGHICQKRKIEITISKLKEIDIVDFAKDMKPSQTLKYDGAEYTYTQVQRMNLSLTISIPYASVMEAAVLGEDHEITFSLND